MVKEESGQWRRVIIEKPLICWSVMGGSGLMGIRAQDSAVGYRAIF
jgi:hypothetical protein